jgi:hypothetical protein
LPRKKPQSTPPSPARYEEWISYLFDQPLISRTGDVHAEDFDASDREIAALFAATMRRCGDDLLRFSVGQVAQGLDFLFNPALSNHAFSLKAESVPKSARIEALQSIHTLYTDCFERRCEPVLSHLDEPGSNPLNSVCYMMWDVSPLNYWKDDPDAAFYYDRVVDLLDQVLALENQACQESALHGLGHTAAYARPGQVAAVIDRFLRLRKNLRPELAHYARCAVTGSVL